MSKRNYLSWEDLTESEQSDYEGQHWAKDSCFFRFNGVVYDYDNFSSVTILELAEWDGDQ